MCKSQIQLKQFCRIVLPRWLLLVQNTLTLWTWREECKEGRKGEKTRQENGRTRWKKKKKLSTLSTSLAVKKNVVTMFQSGYMKVRLWFGICSTTQILQVKWTLCRSFFSSDADTKWKICTVRSMVDPNWTDPSQEHDIMAHDRDTG